MFSKAMVIFCLWGLMLPWPASAQDPEFERMVEGVARAYNDLRNSGRYREALELVEREIEESTDGVPIVWLFDRCVIQREVGEIDDALTDMDWLYFRRSTPRNALLLAELYWDRGRNEEAEQVLRSAAGRFRGTARYEDEIDELLALYRILEWRGENPKAILQSILDGDPEDTEAMTKRYLAAAELAYRKFDYQLAAQYYGQALELESDHLDAQAGLAACYWRSHDPRLQPTLAKLTARNPLHFRGKAIEAEMKLDAGKAEEALVFIEQMLAIHPVHGEFLGLKAAALFLLDREEALSALFKKALDFNPSASEVYRIAGRIASRHYRFQEGAAFQQKALALDEKDHQARALYAFDLLRLGKDDQGMAELHAAFEADRFNVQVYNLLQVMDTLAKFQQIERGPFLVKMPTAEFAVWGEDMLAMLTEAFEDLQKSYRVKLETPIAVQIFDNHDDFMVRSVGLPGSVGHLGICFGKLITMDSPSAREKHAMNWRSVMYHEFVHVVTLQKTANRMPRWLSEGISVFEETRANPAWGQRLDPQYKTVLAAGGAPGLADMETYFTQPQSPHHLMFGYFSAGEFTRFYVETHGFEALLAALDLIRDGVATTEALARAAGADVTRIDKAFRDYMKRRLAPLNNLPAAQASMLDQMLGAAPANQPLEGKSPFTDALRRGYEALGEQRWDAAEQALKQAHELFPEYMGEDGPLQGLIHLYEQQNRKTELQTVLRRALELNGSDFQACRKLAGLMEEKEDWPACRTYSEWALAIDPFDVPMRRQLLASLEKAGTGKQVLEQLQRLIRLDPHRAVDYRLKRVDVLLAADPERARNEVIRLLEDVPYSWEAQRRLLSMVEERE